LQDWWNDGLRALGLAHYGPSAYAHGTASTGGLTAQGIELVKFMDELGMILDATHLAEDSFWQALELFHGTVIASHNNCRELVPGDRQFSDEQIRTLIERDAVIGAAFDNWMLYPGWVAGQTSSSVVTLENVIDHIDHVCQLAETPDTRHRQRSGWRLRREQSPGDWTRLLTSKIPPLLRNAVTEADVMAIMHGNWLRVFHKRGAR
jgi:membrane dipeptidase